MDGKDLKSSSEVGFRPSAPHFFRLCFTELYSNIGIFNLLLVSSRVLNYGIGNSFTALYQTILADIYKILVLSGKNLDT